MDVVEYSVYQLEIPGNLDTVYHSQNFRLLSALTDAEVLLFLRRQEVTDERFCLKYTVGCL